MKRLMQRYRGRHTRIILIGMIYILPLVLVHGAVDYFLKIEGIPGESTDAKHKEWIEIQSFSSGAERPVSGAGPTRVVGDITQQDLSVAKWIDKSSPVLLLSICDGRVFPKVEFSMVNRATSNSHTHLTYKLSDVLISSFQTSPGGGTSGDPQPSEQISLNFAKIEYEYFRFNPQTGETNDHVTVSCDGNPAGTP